MSGHRLIRTHNTPRQLWKFTIQTIVEADYKSVLHALTVIVLFVPALIVFQPIRIIGNAILDIRERSNK